MVAMGGAPDCCAAVAADKILLREIAETPRYPKRVASATAELS
jgi:hypothetical protein